MRRFYRLHSIRLPSLVGLCLTCTLGCAQSPAAPDGRDIEAELKAVLRETEVALARGASAEEILDMLYHDDVFVVGEGVERATRGRIDFASELEGLLEFWGGAPKCSYEMEGPILHSGSVAVTFVNFVCAGEGQREDSVYRALYGWAETDLGWRIQLEMYGEGAL